MFERTIALFREATVAAYVKRTVAQFAMIGVGVGFAGYLTISLLLSGEGIFNVTLGFVLEMTQLAANIGWAALPLLLMNIISTATIWLLALFGDLPTVTLTQMQLPWWLLLFNTVTSIISYLWIGYLLTYAIHDARNLSVRRAAFVSGIVVAVSIHYALSALLWRSER